MADPNNSSPQENFADLFAASERAGAGAGAPKRVKLRPGDRVRGKIISLGGETVFLELDGGLEGMLDLVELRDGKGQLQAKAGDVIDAVVAEVPRASRTVVLKRSLGRGAGGRTELGQAFQHAIPVEGTVSAVNKGGVEVTVAGVRGFCPISQLDLRHVEDASAFIGQKLMFRITKFEDDDRRGPNIVLSRRAVLEEEARGKAAETRAKLAVGAVVSGVVTALKDYGAFVDLGGIEGMLHVSEIGFQRVTRPADVLAVGQHVSVQILRMEKKDDPKRPGRQLEQIALSLKALETDPWESAALAFTEGSRVRGTVTRVTDFGAFVELAPGVEGLVHISELGGGHSARQARSAVKSGDALDVTVKTVDRERRRLSLTLAAPDEPLDAEARAVVARAAAPSREGKLGTLGDLLKNISPSTRR